MNKDSATLVSVSVRKSVGAASVEYTYYPETDEIHKKEWLGDFMGGGYVDVSEVEEDVLKYFSNFKENKE